MRFLLWGSFWNVAVGALCLGGRRFIKSGSRQGCALGIVAVMTAMFISARSLLGAWLTGRSVLPGLEAVLVWPWLIYAILFAASRVQEETIAEPAASPNGGPAKRLENQGAGGGPPSVS